MTYLCLLILSMICMIMPKTIASADVIFGPPPVEIGGFSISGGLFMVLVLLLIFVCLILLFRKRK